MRIARTPANLTARAILFGLALASAGCGHKNVDDYLQAGDQARQSSRLAEAESDYLAAIKAAPDDPRPHSALAGLYLFENKPGPAENQGRATVVLAPTNVAYRLALADVLRKAQQPGAAEAELRTAVGLAPADAHTHLALANLLASEPNRHPDADLEFAQVKALDASLLQASPAPSPAAGAAPVAAPSSVAAAPPKVRELDKKFLLTKDSPVYDTPDPAGHVLAQVHHRKLVHVTGIAGDWLRVQLKSGVVGYIPVTAAE